MFPIIRILGIGLHAIPFYLIREICRGFMLSGRAHQLITASSLMVLEAQKSPALRRACERATLVLADSSGLCWAASKLGYKPPDRIPGIDLAYSLCEIAGAVGVPVYLIGGAPGVSGQAARHLCREFPSLHVAGMRDGFFRPSDEDAIIRDIVCSRARLVLVALGMPKQDLWIHDHLHRLPPALYMGVGGSFDVWAGRLKRAPPWLRRIGMEWLYRLNQEPSRWRRIAQLPYFAMQIWRVSDKEKTPQMTTSSREI